jgi:hypothetical protein
MIVRITVDSAASSPHHSRFDEQMGRVFAVQPARLAVYDAAGMVNFEICVKQVKE